MKHLTRLMDLSSEEIRDILNLADQLKYETKHSIPHPHLQGKTLGMIFEKVSTRTRVSFEAGMYQLGGHALFLSARDLQMFRGEPVEDTARTLSRYVNGLMIRTFDQGEVDNFARYGSVPVINGMTDFAHPCQVLADLMTVREYKGSLEGLKMAYIGDGNNMCNSLIVGALQTGMRISVACPKGYEPAPEVLAFAEKYGDAFELTHDPLKAAENADDVQTDVWVSSGMESESEQRHRDFAGYGVTAEVMAAAREDAILQHPLPAHRGEEISGELFEAHAGEIFDEAENRLHAQKAVLMKLLGGEGVRV